MMLWVPNPSLRFIPQPTSAGPLQMMFLLIALLGLTILHCSPYQDLTCRWMQQPR